MPPEPPTKPERKAVPKSAVELLARELQITRKTADACLRDVLPAILSQTREGLEVPVLRAEPSTDRIDFELECGHVVGLARCGVANENVRMPTALICPACADEALGGGR